MIHKCLLQKTKQKVQCLMKNQYIHHAFILTPLKVRYTLIYFQQIINNLKTKIKKQNE